MSIDTSKGIAGLKGALRYVRAYRDQVFVVKLGGDVLSDNGVRDHAATQLALLHSLGIRLVVVHGGGPQATALSRRLGAARFSFGRPELLKEVLGVEPGSVTPLALVNDTAGRVQPVLDKQLLDHPQVNCHPLRNTASTAIGSTELVRFMRSCGHEPIISEIDELA